MQTESRKVRLRTKTPTPRTTQDTNHRVRKTVTVLVLVSISVEKGVLLVTLIWGPHTHHGRGTTERDGNEAQGPRVVRIGLEVRVVTVGMSVVSLQ